MLSPYVHKVQYHETDKMGIAHHANYIKWMEEARIDYLDRMGCGYAQMEAEGLISPVVGIDCRYKRPTTFYDVVEVEVWVEEFTGVRLILGYTMREAATQEVVFTATSTHCFTDINGKPFILKRNFPHIAELLEKLIAEHRAEC